MKKILIVLIVFLLNIHIAHRRFSEEDFVVSSVSVLWVRINLSLVKKPLPFLNLNTEMQLLLENLTLCVSLLFKQYTVLTDIQIASDSYVTVLRSI